jgi:hypothetical protein
MRGHLPRPAQVTVTKERGPSGLSVRSARRTFLGPAEQFVADSPPEQRTPAATELPSVAGGPVRILIISPGAGRLPSASHEASVIGQDRK